MAGKAQMTKSQKEPRFSTRKYTHCMVCGRTRAVFRSYLLCRIHLREYIHQGLLPGFVKASW